MATGTMEETPPSLEQSAADFGPFRVGGWRAEPGGNKLIGAEGEEVRLEPKVMEVLVCLTERAGQPVSKAAFMERVWADTVVTDDVLARCVSELRKALGDNPRDPSYIETIRKRGYRLVAPVERLSWGAGPAAPPPSPQPDPAPPAAAAEEAAPERAASDGSEPSSPAPLPAPPVGGRPPVRAAGGGAAPVGEASEREAPPGLTPALWIGALLLVGVVVAALLIPGGDEPAAPLQTVPMTTLPGEETEPELSPDGERLAFVWDGGSEGEPEVYVKQTDAETPLRLTDHPGRESSPTWSPDGRHIAFVRDTDGERAIVLVPVLGGSEREVTNLGEAEVGGLVWAPDGQTLALSVREGAEAPFSLYLFGVESRAVRQLTRPAPTARGDSHPAFSPDGRLVAFVRSEAEGQEEVYVVPTSGADPRQLTDGSREIAGLSWDADGGTIVFASTRAEGPGLWRVPATGGEPEFVAGTGTGDRIEHPSVVGERLTFEERSLEANVWALRPGGRLQRLIASTQWDAHPQVSPDGRRIAFTSGRSGRREIWVADRDGSDPLQLTTLGAKSGTPRWSPDGRRIAFDARPDGNADLFVVEAGGGQPQRLTTHPADDVAPSWSRDSLHVYFGSNRDGSWQVWRARADGSRAPRRVTADGGYTAVEAPDGLFLYYTKKDMPGLWRKPLDAARGEPAEETLVLGGLAPQDWANWAVTPTGIYFVRRIEERSQLRFMPFATGRSMLVSPLGNTPAEPALAVGPNGTVLIAQVDRSESDIILVEDFR